MDGSMEVQGPTLRCTLPSRILQVLKMERIVYPVRRLGDFAWEGGGHVGP